MAEPLESVFKELSLSLLIKFRRNETLRQEIKSVSYSAKMQWNQVAEDKLGVLNSASDLDFLPWNLAHDLEDSTVLRRLCLV